MYTDNNDRCTCKVKCMISMIQAEINKKKNSLTQKINVDLRKKCLKRCICGIGSYCAEIWRPRIKIVTKHLEVLKWGLGEGLNK